VKRAGLKTFDAWAHHPYYAGPSDQPTTKPVSAKGLPSTAVTLANISDLIREVTRLYGPKRIWITEYGYQTNPPDPLFGVSWAKQATYLTQAFAIARRNPRIDMMLWFLLKDEPSLSGWQSGLLTFGGRRKPAFYAFMRMAAAASPAR
jgi:Glycosyl hydrolase catalytic core